jgi:hypothetical protein
MRLPTRIDPKSTFKQGAYSFVQHHQEQNIINVKNKFDNGNHDERFAVPGTKAV